MERKDLRIVYMGTPEFAVAPLAALVEGGYNVVGVITMPDKPAGRGHRLQASPVKEYALAHGLPLLQPERLKDEAFLAALRAWRADLQVVVAFRMLPEAVWAMPRCGTFNLHAALLPQYRGAAPINWAVMNGDTRTGATTFFLDAQIDTGRVILAEEMPIGPDECVGSVHDRLMELGTGLVRRTVDLVIGAEADPARIPTVDQETLIAALQRQAAAEGRPFELRPAPKIFRETCELDFTRPVRAVRDWVRGLSPYPAAWFTLPLSGGEAVAAKVYRAHVAEGAAAPLPAAGTLLTDGRTYLHVACADGLLAIDELQLPGKKRMDVRALLNGTRLATADPA